MNAERGDPELGVYSSLGAYLVTTTLRNEGAEPPLLVSIRTAFMNTEKR
jgi:hypothetical protein